MRTSKYHTSNPPLKNKQLRARVCEQQYNIVREKATQAGIDMSEYIRQATINGYIRSVNYSYDTEEIRALKNLLTEYKKHFIKIGNLIKNHHPRLNEEITVLKDSLQRTVDKINL